MKIKKAFLIGNHRYSYRNNEECEIIGVKVVEPDGLKPRLCFEVLYNDGVIDFIPVISYIDKTYKLKD